MKKIKLLDTGQRNETMATVLPNEQSSKKEINRIRVKEWRKNNPDKYRQHLEYVKQWKDNNKQRISEYGQNYYQENKEHFNEYYSRPEVKERARHNQREYRKRKKLEKAQPPVITAQDIKELLKLEQKIGRKERKSVKRVRKYA